LNAYERDIRAAVYASFRDTGRAPTTDELAAAAGAPQETVIAALRALADEHALVLLADGETIRMAHPFSGVATDFHVTAQDRCWTANCAWDGLAILALFGDGRLDTHSPATSAPLRFEVVGGRVTGEGLIHFLVPAAHFWDDIGYT
jgi:hypothetical protein